MTSEEHLFSPITLRSVTIRNRLWIAPMCQYSVFEEDGCPTDWHLVHLGSRAVGGAGMIIVEASAVEPRGRISMQDIGLWDDRQAEAWQPINRFMEQHGAVPGDPACTCRAQGAGDRDHHCAEPDRVREYACARRR